MWNSTSRLTEGGTKYEIGQLDLLINFLGMEIERQEDSDDLPLAGDAEYEWHYSPFLNGITNGEFLFCAFEILSEMLSDEPAKPAPMYKEAVLASILDCAETDFLERCDSEFFDEEAAQDIWELWKACRANKKLPVWEDENGQPADPPALKDIPQEKWEYVFEFIHDEFLWDRDWEIPFFGGNLALVQQQPHWPTFQEYRTAKTWLLALYGNTRSNRQEREEKSRKKQNPPTDLPKAGKSERKSKTKGAAVNSPVAIS
jgi:hypothetical protein